MTTVRELLTAAYNGETPERTPFSIYEWFFVDPRYDRAAFEPLIDMGLGITGGAQTVKSVQHGAEWTVRHEVQGNRRINYGTLETPVGTLHQESITPLTADQGILDWVQEDWIQQPSDYKIMQWVVEHTELVPSYDDFAQAEDRMGDDGIVIVGGNRTPAQTINLDYAGTERFCMDVALEVPELFDLYEAMKKLFLEEVHLIADGPGRFVKWTENLTIGMLGPKRYESLLLSIYNEAVPILEAGNKRVMVHYDGQLKVITDHIARAPFHIIESLTEPPEGDMMYDECRAAWPDKAFAAHLNLDLYDLPDEQLRDAVIVRRERAGKRGLSFEISEEVPKKWREKIPVVLQALASPSVG